jgi:CHAT domain-containing protein
MLAFGNAVYNVAGTQNISNLSQDGFIELMKGVDESAKNGESMKQYYNALGYVWDNLPGTEAELNAISALVPTATIIKGKEVNKQNIKQLSKNGSLKNYKIIHFATHGVVIPEFQELSSIVLTQGLTTDDGYLRASEVSSLNINADFVNLSACETGLGKIYEGEGVVGLTQSFLLAGANSVAVSLWQVNDQSTMEFQKELYRLVFTEKLPVSKAINQVKRIFIKGQYNQPFYWAPFVFYGN